HREYEAGLAEAKTQLDAHHLNLVDGQERSGDGASTVRSPIDREIVLGHCAIGPRQDVKDAVEAARRAQPAWFALGWEKRIEILKRGGQLITHRPMVSSSTKDIE